MYRAVPMAETCSWPFSQPIQAMEKIFVWIVLLVRTKEVRICKNIYEKISLEEVMSKKSF